MNRVDFSLFFKANLFFTICLFLFFLQYNNQYNGIEFLILILGSISSAAILYFLIYIVLFIFTFAKKLIIYFSASIFVMINMGLVVDFFIFRLYKFHINAMVINILMSPDAMDSIDMGMSPILIIITI